MSEIEDNHGKMVAILAKNGEVIKSEMNAFKAGLMHMTMGICGEAGELLDGIKKHIIYDKTLDFDNIVEELGDIEFYLEGLRQELNVTRDRTLKANMDKLAKRYPNYEYTNQRAHDRADKSTGSNRDEDVGR